MDKAIEAVIEGVKAASPTLWLAAQAKVQADLAVAHFWLWACVVGVLACVVVFGISAWVGDGGYSDWPVVMQFISGVGGVSCLVGIGVNYTIHLQISAAPQWYAIKALVELSPLK